MQAYQPWIGEQAFGDDADGLVAVSYKSHQDALDFVRRVLTDPQGVGLLQGPDGSGKTTIVKRLTERLPPDSAFALVDGARVKSRELLSKILGQYGYDAGLESHDELFKMVNVFAMQQARSVEAPVLIVDNVDQMYPSALNTLSNLAKIKLQSRFALRIIVTGREPLGSLAASGGMANLEERCLGSFVIHPLSLKEALIYLHARLSASGVNNAETVFPVDVCDRLYQQSGGWPGSLNKHAALAIERARDFPLTVADTRAQKDVLRPGLPAAKEPILGAEAVKPLPPRAIVSRDGKTLGEFALSQKKVLIGRSDFADILIEDQFVSKMHAALLLYQDALVLVDLNSANGTAVNSVPVSSTVLKDDDIVSLGNHRLKIENVPEISTEMAKLLKTPETVKMKNLVDMRRARARRLALAASRGQKKG